MIIKIQKALFSSDGKTPFLLYNKSKTFEAQIHEGEPGYEEINKFYKDHDEGTGKIYASATLSPEGFLEIKGTLKYPNDKRTDF